MNAATATLRAYYDATYLPTFLAGADPRTIDAYAGTLGVWEKFSADPPLRSITTVTLAQFKAAVAASTSRVTKRQVSPATVNKHLRHVGAMLTKAGPPGPRNRDALQIIERVPWVKPYKLQRRLPTTIAQATLAQIYDACENAVHPIGVGIAPAAWWRALIVTAYNTGLRKQALLGMRWADVDGAGRVIRVPAELDKCDQERLKPLHAEVLRHLEAIRSTSAVVFPWPASEKAFYRQWHDIQGSADVAKHHKLHDLKRTCGTEVGRVSNALVVRDMLDHSTVAMSSAYVDTTEPLRAAVERLPQPWRQAQRTLFD